MDTPSFEPVPQSSYPSSAALNALAVAFSCALALGCSEDDPSSGQTSPETESNAALPSLAAPPPMESALPQGTEIVEPGPASACPVVNICGSELRGPVITLEHQSAMRVGKYVVRATYDAVLEIDCGFRFETEVGSVSNDCAASDAIIRHSYTDAGATIDSVQLPAREGEVRFRLLSEEAGEQLLLAETSFRAQALGQKRGVIPCTQVCQVFAPRSAKVLPPVALDAGSTLLDAGSTLLDAGSTPPDASITE